MIDWDELDSWWLEQYEEDYLKPSLVFCWKQMCYIYGWECRRNRWTCGLWGGICSGK